MLERRTLGGRISERDCVELQRLERAHVRATGGESFHRRFKQIAEATQRDLRRAPFGNYLAQVLQRNEHEREIEVQREELSDTHVPHEERIHGQHNHEAAADMNGGAVVESQPANAPGLLQLEIQDPVGAAMEP